MQEIITKNHGKIQFLKTWVSGNIHIGITKDGDYRHIGGPFVDKVEDLSVIGYGPDYEYAKDWFDETYNKKPVAPDPAQKAQTVEPEAPVTNKVFDSSYLEKLKANTPSQKKAVDKKVCPICSKEVGSSVALIGHMRTHKKDVPPVTAEQEVISE